MSLGKPHAFHAVFLAALLERFQLVSSRYVLGVMNSLGRTKRQRVGLSGQKKWFLLAVGLCLGWGIALDPLAAAARAGTVYRGDGQIVSGQGQFARLQLTVEIDRGRIRTRSGPALDARFSGGTGTFQNSEGTWQIDHRGDLLNITLYRGGQVIRYRLVPDRKGDGLPQTTVDKSLGFSLGVPNSLNSTGVESAWEDPDGNVEFDNTEIPL